MNIIIDTNLWISFAIGKKLSALQHLITDKNLTIYICEELCEEFITVCSRNKIRKYISEKEIIATLQLMDFFCESVAINKKTHSPVRDPKDLYLLSLADTIAADYIITGDKDLLVLQRHNQTKIVSYNDFVKVLEP